MTQPDLKESEGAGTNRAWLLVLSQKLDDFLRFLDLRSRRTVGGWMDVRFHVDRHTIAALWLPSVLCGLLVLGAPTPIRFGISALVTFLVGAVLVRQMQFASRQCRPVYFDLVAQVVAVLAVSGVVWIVGSDEYGEIWPYRHALIPLAVATAVALLVGAALLGPIFRWPLLQSKYSDYLPRTELFASRGETPPFSVATFLTGSSALAIQAPLALLTVPAIATLIVPPIWIPLVPIAAGALCIAALLLAGLNDRFAAMWLLLQEVLFKGGALLVSLVVVALAGLRLWGVTYVTTIFDSAAWWTIVTAFVSAYVVSWWFDYWLHRMLTDHMLRLLDPTATGKARIPYPIAEDARHTSVPSEGRVLQVHGAARYLVLQEASGDATPYFQAHRPQQLIELLASSGAPGGKAVPTPGQIASRMASYQVVVALLFAVIVGVGILRLHAGIQLPEVKLQLANGGGLSLQELLLPASVDANDAPMIVVAASGGGTRAAVYTAAVLEGIARHGKVDRVVLGSGVSGGGAALAYFAGHRKQLVEGTPSAWEDYFKTMTQPFIQDVLQRATEWRMVSSGRLGMLLSASFEQRWGLVPGRITLADVSDMGLIFNTSLAGHFERPQQAPAGQPLYAVEPAFRDETKSTLAGGRLLLTNLSIPAALVSRPIEPDATLATLPVVIRSPELRLEVAAALNANFPPVFSNAAIDVDDRIRYWVTDGGAVDNRGMEMLLYAVRRALEAVPDDRLPRLHIVVADASAFSGSYSQDRGVSTMAGAGARYASHLDAELVEAIRKRYASRPERFEFSYVMMPDILRESGSFGTHWMLQDKIKVRYGDAQAVVSGPEMVEVLRALHSGDGSRLGPDASRVLQWSRQDPGHSNGWGAVLRSIGGSDRP